MGAVSLARRRKALMATSPCPVCTQPVEVGARFCPNCGHYMEWDEVEEPTEVVASMTRKPGDEVRDDPPPVEPPPTPTAQATQPQVVCPHCGTLNDPSRTLCSYCGQRLFDEPEPVTPPPPPDRPGLPKWAPWAIGGAAVVLVLILIWVFTGNGGDDGANPTLAPPTSAGESATTTSPTEAPGDGDAAAYVGALQAAVTEAQLLVDDATAANGAWDEEEDVLEGEDRADLFIATETALVAIADRARQLVDDVAALERPESVRRSDRQAVLAAARSLRDAADGMLDGLRQPRGEKSLRLESLDALGEAADALESAVAVIAGT